MDANNHSVNIKQSRGVVSAIVPAALLVAGMFGYSHGAQAAVACSISTVYPPVTLTPSINAAASYAGNDLEIGHAIYTTSAGFSTAVGVKCDDKFSLQTVYGVSSAPSGPPTIMNTEYGTGPVYPTNVSGVGVIVWTGTAGFTQIISSGSGEVKGGTLALDQGGGDASVDGGPNISAVTLIKTGPIASGAVVNGSSLPHISLGIPATTGYTGLPLRLMDVSFSGALQFVTQTCTTPDVNVNLGKYDIGTTFTKVGSHSSWVDSSILLENCPKFSGYYSHFNGGEPQGSVDSAPTSGGVRAANLITVSLQPATPVTDNIIGLEASDDAASGVGIQLGYSKSINAIPTAPQTLWKSGVSWNVTAPSDGRNTVKIPLAARYYQNADRVAPGKANAKVTFNIYYK